MAASRRVDEGSVRPVIIAGTGRCGSSLLHDVLSSHVELAWLTGLLEGYPEKTGLNRAVMRSLDVPVLARVARRRFEPVEGYAFWDHYAPGFSEPFRDLRADDVTEKVRKNVRRAMAEVRTGGRPRLLLKITGWPRLGYLRRIFPEARFVYVIRDGRAVANSLLNVGWWRGWSGPSGWRWGELPDAMREIWEEADRSFVVLAGLQWKLLVEAYESTRHGPEPADVVTVRYEDLCRDPADTVDRILAFSDLRSCDPLRRAIEKTRFRSANEKWRRQLTPDQQAMLNRAIGDVLDRHGYL